MVDAMAVGASALAVPDAAVAYVVAGMCRLGERRPLLVVTPTVVDAERLSHDIGAFLGSDVVELFPAWDTLPFERVSPELSTMGRRLRLLWRLQDPSSVARRRRRPGAGPAAAVGPGRRGGRARGGVAPATVSIRQELVSRLVALGYRREYQVEHRGELAVRGGIVDVYPSTAELPVRIDLWGDEVDRLTEFDPGDQRSVSDLDSDRALRVPRGASRPTPCGPAPPRSSAPSRGDARSGSAWPRDRSSTGWSRGCRGSSTRSVSCPTWWARAGASCSSIPAASGTAPPSSTTRRRPWPGRWPSRGASSPALPTSVTTAPTARAIPRSGSPG